MTKRKRTPEHGHYLNYLRDGHRDPECVEAWRTHCNKLRARRFRKGLRKGDHRHGTPNGYTNWGCRCKHCRDAHRIQRQGE